MRSRLLLKSHRDVPRQRGHTSRTCSVEMTILILVFLVGGLWETEAISVTGMLGEEVKIKCSHSNAYSLVKYFCKGACEYKDVLITSSGTNPEPQGKYSIIDEGNTFYVTIRDLTEEDSGLYWCGIERFGIDTYTEVVVTVMMETTNDSDTIPRSGKLVYIGTGIGVVLVALVALAIVLLIFFRHRNREISAASVNIKLSSSAAQPQDTRGDDASGDQSQSDGIFYTTVSFNKHTDCSSVPAIYSNITNVPSDE